MCNMLACHAMQRVFKSKINDLVRIGWESRTKTNNSRTSGGQVISSLLALPQGV